MNTDKISSIELTKILSIFVTYDPMNPGNAVAYNISGDENFKIIFPSKYGAHIKLLFKGGIINKPFLINEISVHYTSNTGSKEPIIKIGNLTSRKYYTATDVVEVANESLAAGAKRRLESL